MSLFLETKKGVKMSENLEKVLETKSQSSPSSKYPALETMIGIFKILAWLLGIVAVICAIVSFADGSPVGMFFIIVGALIFVLLFAIAESIKVFIDIEANTRRIAEVK